MKKLPLTLDLQFFADDKGTGDNGGQVDKVDVGNSDNGDKDTSSNTFTQEDVNNVVAKEVKKSQEKLFQQLGITDFESAKDGMQKFKEWEETNKTEKEKADEQLTTLEQSNADLKAQLEKSNAVNEALKLGITADSVSDAITLAQARVNDDTDISKALKSVLEQYPNFSKTETKEEGKTPPTFMGTDHHNGGEEKLNAFEKINAKYK